MLLEFGFKNFFCFKEGISISFKLDSNCPVNISHGRNFTTVLGIKGANGAGKTHVLKGLAFLSDFCANSFSSKPEEVLGIDTFFENNRQSEFYAEFLIEGVTYFYELSITRNEVKREVIYRKKGVRGKKVKILERNDNELTAVKEFSRLNAIKLRKNASLISTAHQYEFDELEDIHTFFKYFISNVSYGGLAETPRDIKFVSEFLNEHKGYLKFIKEFVTGCDTGISDINIIKLKGKKGAAEFFPIFVHVVDKKPHPVTMFSESSGTKALFRDLTSYKLVLETGGLLILDEFDTHLHPHILPKLIQLFFDPKINKKNAQIIFSTHDAEILNLLGRYRTYLINKEENESFVYRLDEIPGDILRNDRPILPAYNEGRIGGIPKL